MARRAGSSIRIAALCASVPVTACYAGLPESPGADHGDAETGESATGESGTDGMVPSIDAEMRGALGPIPLRRLSRREYADSVAVLTGVQLSEIDLQAFPQDNYAPFDNDTHTQVPSAAIVEALKRLAEKVVAVVEADPGRWAALVPCSPSAVDDACTREFVTRFGRRALRRPLTSEEIDRYVAAAAAIAETNEDPSAGIRVAMQAFLQDSEFIYRVELGAPVPDAPELVKLDAFELASRLSFLLWGTGPDDALLDAAAAGELDDDVGLEHVALDMLAAPAARSRMTRFVAMWLGFDRPLPNADLEGAMQAESAALIERVVFEGRSWLELFTSTETFVDADLASHYQLPAPTADAGGWVVYPADSGRAGILAHAAFLANGLKAGDTSPTQRGYTIRERLACQHIPPPPPDLMVDVDNPPTGNDPDACKIERYRAQVINPGCSGCHAQMDPIGFGLENYDAMGRFRESEPERPECTIDGDGEWAGVGSFRGPAELAEVLVASDSLDRCTMTQLFRFAVGRHESDADNATLDRLTQEFRDLDHRFEQLLVDFVTHPSFRYRELGP